MIDRGVVGVIRGEWSLVMGDGRMKQLLMGHKSVGIYVAILLLLTFIPVTAFEEDSPGSRITMSGLQGLRVVVEELQPNLQGYAAKFGLSSAQIKKDVEQRLRENGIRIMEGDEWLKIPGRPVLSISVNTHETERYWYAYDITVELRQLAFLEANPKIKTLASTWSLSATGLANIGNLQVIRNDVGVLAGKFMAAYKMANK